MPAYKNKILIISAVYLASLIAIAAFFGLWHNVQLRNGTSNYFIFIVLLSIVLLIITWFYYNLYKIYASAIKKSEEEMQITNIQEEVNEDVIVETQHQEEDFNIKEFIQSIVPVNVDELEKFCEKTLQNLAGKLNLVQGIFYTKYPETENFEPSGLYAYYSENHPSPFKIGETLPGQAVKDNRVLIIQNIPDNYIPVVSGLGSSKPKNLIMIPVISGNEPVGLIEIALFASIHPQMESALKELGGIIGKNIIKLMK